ncbi:MAG: rRNA maturation RNase YbeY [Lachnospiraceae bacterium]|nr:rRNA maturation RNase YbeY [Lachnospiraceae bacterium]
MTFYVENETGEEFSFDEKKLIEMLTDTVLKKLDCPYKDISLNVTFTDDESIREINKEFREIDKSTDVLSFPALDFDVPGDFSLIKENDSSYFDLETGELLLGDIMISLEHAHKQAEEYGHSFRREIAFLITHSLLHLCGYDHMTDDDRIVMEDLQNEILNSLGITRENG